MTDEDREYMHARQQVMSTLVDPVTALITATGRAITVAQRDAREAREELERMRPVWEQQASMTSDVRATITAAALGRLWALLRAPNQTVAIERLTALVSAERDRERTAEVINANRERDEA